ncbi:DUF5104 domain-containing protein [Clostridium estertheticum]|uniref:DUF5104 domain-containing protein n=2 Tax=Clostridium estertheticum TaxID=238834 RepID=A0A1J0GGB5_9CLOT|nr:DUF5104 domain-containing protein [Clostridium estertheticum]APC40339.1 DUF5104 domain-containing protein [Clostridium estertheticum subsp. estertheticum]MBU3174281.1 DUF5104 domain-containing protein [Clostridium estertheticum]MBZ9617844.1 DUF5104 domain-containing protein [Clostridium estertheticum subsp. laramiense]MPQ31656.1 DUF5104 domain-containing protein [Clostridium estertheticum]MPQ62320.1 DUF5104 domain-containing protein [Clostridium estertheticum]
MNIKRLILLITIITLSLGLIACNSIKSKIVKAGASALNVKSDREIANTRFQNIIECLENNNKEGLKKMFSPKALKEAKDIDGGIDYIRSFYKGKIKSKDVALAVSENKDNGEMTSDLKAFYTVTTDKDTYIVFFKDQTVDTKDPNNVGLSMLQIIKKSDREKEFDWGGDKTKCAGIYRPATAKK